MKFADWVVLGIVAALTVLALIRIKKHRGGACHGDCARCAAGACASRTPPAS